MNGLVLSILSETKRLIRHYEGDFAAGVIADLEEALERSEYPLRVANRWLKSYRKFYGKVRA